MGKDKASINPAQAQRKLEKQKALKKGKAEVAARRNERLAHRNPERLLRQIEELKSLEASGQPLQSRDRRVLEGLEKDVQAVKKAREALGDRAPRFNRSEQAGGDRGRGHGRLGKRKREDDLSSSGSETNEDVRRIPMPKDTPPPLPPLLSRHGHERNTINANRTPLGMHRDARRSSDRLTNEPRATVETPTQIVYEAAPVVRDLRKEAINAFIPSAVQKKIQQEQGHSRLLEPAELDSLEREGYGSAKIALRADKDSPKAAKLHPSVTNGVANSRSTLDEEERLFEKEVQGMDAEEVGVEES
ncbi:MAG: hypothetical protein M1835_005586 [Candelina submexicana]|nr:MAG: hypothetical protein M1835_005586 [Candelina submexicana]